MPTTAPTVLGVQGDTTGCEKEPNPDASIVCPRLVSTPSPFLGKTAAFPRCWKYNIPDEFIAIPRRVIY